MERRVAHIDLDSFFVSVECLKHPEWKDLPLIVGGTSGRGVVAACSYEARKYGIHSAMPMAQAMRLCPKALVVKGSHEEYRYYSQIVTKMIADAVPLFEKASIDEFYLDLSGMEKYFDVTNYCKELREKIIKTTGLPMSMGIAAGKVVSKIAANEAKPNGFLEVPRGADKAFLAPLSIDKMPMIGQKTAMVLRRMGIETLGQLATRSVGELETRLGKAGLWLWERAQGIDRGEIVNYREQKSMSKERTYFDGIENEEVLLNQLMGLIQQVTTSLRRLGKDAGTVGIKIRYEGFETHVRQMTVSPTSSDHQLVPYIKQLFHELYDRRRKVRLLGVRLSNLVEKGTGADMFVEADRKEGLYEAMDKLQEKYKSLIVKPASSLALFTNSGEERSLKKS